MGQSVNPLNNWLNRSIDFMNPFDGNPAPWPQYHWGSPTGQQNSDDFNLELTSGQPVAISGLHKDRCDLFGHASTKLTVTE